MSNKINSILIDQNNSLIYIAGKFNSIGTLNTSGVAKWNYITGIWSSLGSGINFECTSLAFDSSNNLYVGTLNASLYMWNGLSWIDKSSTISGSVRSLYYKNNNLYIGCTSYVYIYDLNSTMTEIYSSTSDDIIYSIIVDLNNDIYIGGKNDTDGAYIKKYLGSPNSWKNIGNNTVSGSVCYTLVIDSSNNLYAGGKFTTLNNGITYNNIARYNNGNWYTLGTGLSNGCRILYVKNDILYAGGEFTTAGGQNANRIAYWNNSSWTSFPTGIDNNSCNTIGLNELGILYTGGSFTSVSSNLQLQIQTLNNLATWASPTDNTTTWNTLSLYLNYLPNFGSGTSYFQIAPLGTSIILSGGSPFTRTGYTLSGWNTNSLGTGNSYSLSGNTTLNNSMKLYAQWTINNYTISFNSNGGTGSVNSISGTYGSNGTIPSGDSLYRVGYTFSNWNTQQDGSGTTYQVGETVTFNNSFTLYAQWTANTYTITFEANNDSGDIVNIPEKYDTTVTIPDGNKLFEYGHVFENWNTNSSGTGTVYEAGEKIVVTESATLYAQWKLVDPDLSQTIDYSYRLVEGFVNFFMEYENQNDYIISIIDNEYNIFLSDSIANTPSFTNYHQFNLAVLLLAAGYLDFGNYM